MTNAIEIRNAVKKIDSNEILCNVSLTVPTGTVYGITGHNGAGKSMLLRAITGLVILTSGEIKIHGQIIGKDIEFAPNTGALIDIPGFLPRYSGKQNLQFLANIQRKITSEQIDATMIRVGLDPTNKKGFVPIPRECGNDLALRKLSWKIRIWSYLMNQHVVLIVREDR